MAYYIKYRGLKNRWVVRERATKAEAEKLADFYRRHGINPTVGTIRADGQHARPKKEVA